MRIDSSKFLSKLRSRLEIICCIVCRFLIKGRVNECSSASNDNRLSSKILPFRYGILWTMTSWKVWVALLQLIIYPNRTASSSAVMDDNEESSGDQSPNSCCNVWCCYCYCCCCECLDDVGEPFALYGPSLSGGDKEYTQWLDRDNTILDAIFSRILGTSTHHSG
jgi:hypothetical protein